MLRELSFNKHFLHCIIMYHFMKKSQRATQLGLKKNIVLACEIKNIKDSAMMFSAFFKLYCLANWLKRRLEREQSRNCLTVLIPLTVRIVQSRHPLPKTLIKPLCNSQMNWHLFVSNITMNATVLGRFRWQSFKFTILWTNCQTLVNISQRQKRRTKVVIKWIFY